MGGVATRVASPEFIGRRQELGSLRGAVARGTAGDAVVVLVGGDAGIGKTRLVEEVAIDARQRGWLVLEGGCVSLGNGEGLPFAPIVEALRRLPAIIESGGAGAVGDMGELRTSETSDLGHLLPELGPTTSPDQGMYDRPGWVQARIFEGLLALLRCLGDAIPVVLIVEDLHWADDSTRDVLSFLARNARTERLAVVGTYRTDELNRRHPLRPWLSEMDRLPRVARIEVSRFGRSELDAQITAILGHRPPVRLLDVIERRAEGNPFFVEELLASGADRPAEPLPPTLRDVLLTRVTALSENAQRVLGYAAVAGRTVEADLLAEVAQVDEPDIEGPLREALAAQILTIDPMTRPDAYRFRHALLAEAVYDDLLPSERRRIHAAYGAVLDARPVPGGAAGVSHLAALAHHATAAHEPVLALRAWVRAARAASETHAYGEAARAYEHAIELWDAVPADDRPSDADAAALYHEGALAAMISGRNERAVDLAQAAVARLDPDRDLERWAAANERLARAMWIAGGLDEGLARLEATAERLERDEPTPMRARIMAAIAGMHMLIGDHPKAIVTANTAIAIARATGSRLAEANALNTLGTSTALIGECADGVSLLREAFAVAREFRDVDDIGRGYANLSSVLTICGQADESYRIAMEGVTWARSVGASGGFGRFLANNAVEAADALGRWDEAERVVDELLVGEPEGVNRLGMIASVGPLFARRGRKADAERLLGEGRDLISTLVEAQFTGPIYVGLVELALNAGRPDEAAETAVEGVERIGRTSDRFYQSELHAIAARADADRAEIARASRDTQTAAAAATTAAEHRDVLRIWAAESPGPQSFGGLLASDLATATAEARRAEGEAHPAAWQTAVETADRAGSAWRKAYTRYRYAEALLGARAPRPDAARALGDAMASAETLSAEPLIGWIDGLARRSRVAIPDTTPATATEEPERPSADDHGLTAREREVLALLVEGHTNRRIGERLFISESTAGVHVSNILGKLGVSTRTEAATVAARLGLVD
jgi:DNA-binding CsgD family transcriptional regulator/tetratricopeptide (TPR) repeat protein